MPTLGGLDSPTELRQLSSKGKLMRVLLDKDLAETLSYWATTAGIIIAVLAGAAAYWKFRKDHKLHEWDRARVSYERFMDLAIQHPQFYPGSWSNIADSDHMLMNQYRWFMGRFLWACEEILVCSPDDLNWQDALALVVAEHVDYFTSPEGKLDAACYYDVVQKWLSKSIAAARPPTALA
jgi:hypothetical protein